MILQSNKFPLHIVIALRYFSTILPPSLLSPFLSLSLPLYVNTISGSKHVVILLRY